MKPTIDVCLSPALFPMFDTKESIVVVIDVLRATSSICIAFEYGAEMIVPVASVEESFAYKSKGFLVGAERQGAMLEGFDFGNSPFSYMQDIIKGAKISLTTTNGTQAINTARNAHKIAIGSFLNLDSLCNWLRVQNRNVLCLCSGWKNSFNLEDTLCAGAIAEQLKDDFDLSDFRDATLAAQHLYNAAKNDIYKFLEESSHRKRLSRLNINDDVIFCLKPNQTNVVPVLKGNALYNENINN